MTSVPKQRQQNRLRFISYLAVVLVFLVSPAIWAQHPKFDAPLGDPLDPSAEQEAFKQYDSSAAQLQNEAIDKLMNAAHLAKVAIIDDDFKDKYQKQAVAEVTDALKKFEEAASDAKKAAAFAADSKQMGITPQPTYDPEGAAKALDSMRKTAYRVAAASSGPDFNATQELYLKTVDLEIRSINELGEAVKAAQAAGMKDPEDTEGRKAKEEEALDHAKRALGGFELAQGTAIAAGGMRMNQDSDRSFYTPYFVPYGRNTNPNTPPGHRNEPDYPTSNYPNWRFPQGGAYGR